MEVSISMPKCLELGFVARPERVVVGINDQFKRGSAAIGVAREFGDSVL